MNAAKAMGKPDSFNSGFRRKVEREAMNDPFFRMLLAKLPEGKGAHK